VFAFYNIIINAGNEDYEGEFPCSNSEGRKEERRG